MFVFSVHSVKSRFQVLNQTLYDFVCLRRLFNKENLGVINKLAKMYDQMSDAIDIINSTFSIAVSVLNL